MDPQNLSNTNMNQPMNQPNGEKKVGPIVATLIIVLILIIAALYLFASKIKEPAIPNDNLSPQTDEVPEITNESTEVFDLQRDLNNSTSGLDDESF